MTLLQASEQYNIELEKLILYEKEKLLICRSAPDGVPDYEEQELKKVGLIHLLLKAGFTFEEIRIYLSDNTTNSAITKKINLLKRQRSKTLDDIHDKEKLLQHLDYLIHETEKEKKQ